MSVRLAFSIALLSIVLVLAGLWVGENVDLLPLQASINAPVYDELFQVLFSIGTMLFLGVTGLLIYAMVRFRRSAGDLGDGAAIEGNLPLEIVWTAIPAVVVLFVGLYSYNIYERMGGMVPLNDHGSMHAMAAMEEKDSDRVWAGIGSAPGLSPAVSVDVTAMQFAFIFRYPDRNIISGELHVPEGQLVQLNMQANDVIHAFWGAPISAEARHYSWPTNRAFFHRQPPWYLSNCLCRALRSIPRSDAHFDCGPWARGLRAMAHR